MDRRKTLSDAFTLDEACRPRDEARRLLDETRRLLDETRRELDQARRERDEERRFGEHLATVVLSECKKFVDRQKRKRSRPPDLHYIRAVAEYRKTHTWPETDARFRRATGSCERLVRRAKQNGYLSDL
jgi:hypothetical protein